MFTLTSRLVKKKSSINNTDVHTDFTLGEEGRTWCVVTTYLL